MNQSMLKQILALRRNALISLAVLFAVAAMLQLFMTFYHEPRRIDLQTEWLQQREKAGRGAVLQNREMIYKTGQADLAGFRSKIYFKSHFARFIGELYEMAAKNSLELLAISYKPTINKEEQLLEYQLSITVSGPYLQLKKFIRDLNASANILVINSISLVSTGPSADAVQLQIQIATYFRLDEQ